MVLIYITCKNTAEAKRIGTLLVNQHLASCVNIWPIESAYLDDQSTLKEDTEAVLLVKSVESKVQHIEDIILQNHTYSTPFIGTVDVRRVNREYKEWMAEVVR